MWDLFISHAPEDTSFVEELEQELQEKRLTFTDIVLEWGDNLTRSIDQAFGQTDCGVIVLSQAFFDQLWPQRELDYLGQISSQKRWIIPVWHNISQDYVRQFSPRLAELKGISSAQGITDLAAVLRETVSRISSMQDKQPQPGTLSASPPPSIASIAAIESSTAEQVTSNLINDGSETSRIYTLFNHMITEFTVSELNDLYLDLGLDYHQMPKESDKTANISAMLQILQQNGRLPELIEFLKVRRPHIAWS